MATSVWLRLSLIHGLIACGCGGSSNAPAAPSPLPTTTPTSSSIVYLVGAGDIADCSAVAEGGIHGQATARLIENQPEAYVFTAGDNAYFFGSAEDYDNCYKPSWGRFLSRTYPSPGNHDYDSGANGVPYFDFFAGRPVGDRGAGFYSYTLGNWHIVSLNSSAPVGPGSEQANWLARDLESNGHSTTARCTLAYWHHPLFTSGPSAGSNGLMRPIWDVLYKYGVDVVVNGHDHLYERYFPQDPSAIRGPAGITEYIAGTGGAPLYDFGPTAANSATRFRTWGVLYFTLRDIGWDSVFLEAGTGARLDFSSGFCH
ncbi:MAG: metallophosphoesterase family protein [Vicinamibacterales bacterium]